MTPYYEDDAVTIWLGDCREIDAWLVADALVTDPPYGIGYDTGKTRIVGSPTSIINDDDTSMRDAALERWGLRPALVFGSWKRPHPAGMHTQLVWDTKGALGMGDLSVPWKPAHQEIYVLGQGFTGPRTSDVLTFPPVQATGRSHPHEKPVDLMTALLVKCPPGIIADPFMGSGTTLRAAKNLGRRSVGVELDERYCEIAAHRMGQEVLDLGGAA